MNRSIVLSLAIFLAGCSYNAFTPQYDAQFGNAVRAAKQAQMLHPDAGTQQTSVGLEGTAAENATLRYQESFKTPPPVVNVINIGGQMGSGR
jgi:hypothetical protein